LIIFIVCPIQNENSLRQGKKKIGYIRKATQNKVTEKRKEEKK
jgi:hypothetical protein